MITLNDCIEFCGTPRTVVEEIAEQECIPVVVACAYAFECERAARGECLQIPVAPEQSRLVA